MSVQVHLLSAVLVYLNGPVVRRGAVTEMRRDLLLDFGRAMPICIWFATLSTLGLTLSPAADAQISSLLLKHDPILHWARGLLPAPRAAAASALYAWCRRLDEIVDDPSADAPTKRELLDQWEGQFDKLYSGCPVDEFDDALLATLRAHPNLGRKPFDAMLAGMRDDTLESVRYENWRPELLTYCYRVAGSVGEMLLPVLGLTNPAARDSAVALGCAVQLLNILRDLRTDLIGRGRIYLPLSDARRCGISEAELEETIRSGTHASPALRRLVRMQSRRAGALLAKAEAALPQMDRATAMVVGVLIELHQELNEQIRQRNYDTLTNLAPASSGVEDNAEAADGRVRVSTVRKATVTANTVASVLLRGPRCVSQTASGPLHLPCSSPAVLTPQTSHALTCRRVLALSSCSGHQQMLLAKRKQRAAAPTMMASDEGAPSWGTLETALVSAVSVPRPFVIDSVRERDTPNFSSEQPTLFRERHGWCPYSERVWLALELKGIKYDTVLIDNTGGGRPSYFSGSTPQIRWANGRTQGESMDLVRLLDTEYPDAPALWPPEGVKKGAVDRMVSAWKGTFPRSSRPSSRAAFLFSYDGDALPRSSFEKVLAETEALLGEHDDGPFFCGTSVSAADVAWAPFLERCAASD